MNRLLQILLGTAVISVIGLLGYYVYLNTKLTQPKGDAGRVAEKEKERARDDIVMKVGNENIYQVDIEYNLRIFYPKAATSEATLSQAKKSVNDQITTNSIILQEGEKEGFAILTKNVFNDPKKNIVERNRLIESTKAKLMERKLGGVKGEAVSIWFNNTSFDPPKIGTAEAKRIAREKIEVIYKDLKSKQISFAEAGKRIAADTSLKDTDPAYKSNAYVRFTANKRSEIVFIDPQINELIWSMKPGDISEILTVNDLGGKDKKPFEAMFKIITITNRIQEEFVDFTQWLETKKKGYKIEYL